MSSLKRFSIGLCFLLLGNNIVLAQTFTFSSGQQRVALLELYTSEGCSSCPPADRWMSKLRESNALWHSVVPIAFHVDYWDYIGWKDRFAKPEFTARQQLYRDLSFTRSVYTPGFFVNGREWRGFFRRQALPDRSAGDVGSLKISLNGSELRATFEPLISNLKDSRLHVALLGFGLKTQVKDGENQGRTMNHDFTVLSLNVSDSQLVDGVFRWQISWPLGDGADASQLGVAAWVSESNNPTPIQATGGYIN